jgi:UDP-N-acetylglucosamine 1-carboxyvinyltransferase
MQEIIIKGGKALNGSIQVSAAKNATLPIMAASLLAQSPIRLMNVPRLKDIDSMDQLMQLLGAKTEWGQDQTLSVDGSTCNNWVAEYDIVRKMRASVLVLAPLLVRFGKAVVSLPGGCAIGTRPVDMHLSGLEQLGASIEIKNGYIHAECKQLLGTQIDLSFPSVGATENLLVAACFARGETIISNAAKEPEVLELARFLEQVFEAKIEGVEQGIIRVQGIPLPDQVKVNEFTILGDRIEAATYLLAGLMTQGQLRVTGIDLNTLAHVIETLESMGFEFKKGDDWIETQKSPQGLSQIKCTDIKTAPFPGFPTDVQAQFMALLTLIEGESSVQETVFENRFMHVPEMNRMGAHITVDGHTANIQGVKQLMGAPVMCTDLRASAALVLCGLVAQGHTVIKRVYHLDRGYEDLDRKLNQVGAEITRQASV